MIPAQNPGLNVPNGWGATKVGNDVLPELPSGWEVAVDTEGSGLFVDGDPIPAGSRPAQPEARISAVSITFRWPNPDGTPGDIVDYAWPFDQGPIVGKPGTPVKDPITGVCTFAPINVDFQRTMLEKASKVLGFRVTMDNAAPNLPASEYAALIGWLDRRDNLAAHNSVHDMHQFRVGLRKGAGGDASVPEGFAAWDPDSEPGQWRLGEFQRLHMMDPSLEPLQTAPNRRWIHCTMVTQKQLIDPVHPAALKPTSRRLWGDDSTDEENELKAELSRQGTGLTKRYDLLPWCGAVGRYAAKDTRLCFQLWEYQLSLVEEGAVLPNYDRLYRDEMGLRTTLYRMERRGVAYDSPRSIAEGETLRKRNKNIAAALPFNPAKPNEVKVFYFGGPCARAKTGWHGDKSYRLPCDKNCPECGGKGGQGIEPLERTEKTRAPKLDVVELRRLMEEGHPFAEEYGKWTKNRNSDSKWYTGWAARTGRDGRIRTSYKQCKNDRERAGAAEGGAKSGRLAVGRWQAQAMPNKHLIPEDTTPVKALIGSTPAGATVVRYNGRKEKTEVARTQFEHDLAAGEMRVVVVIANCVPLWDALDSGADTHAMNAKALFGVDENHPNFKQLRSAAKRATFGILYGGGVRGIHSQVEAASGIHFPMAKVKESIESFFRSYPEFKKMARQAEAKVTRWMGGCGYLTMLDGWRRWYLPDEHTNSAVNQVIQGNLARAMIQWMLEVERQLPGVLLLQVHDSLITEHDDTPEGHAEAQKVSDIGNEVFRKYFGVRGRVMDFGIEPEPWSSKY